MREETRDKLNEVLGFIKNFVNTNGYPPSVREMCIGLNVKSTATVYYYLKMLEEAGMIKKNPQKNRAFEITRDDNSVLYYDDDKESTEGYTFSNGIFSLSGDEYIHRVFSSESCDIISKGDIVLITQSPTNTPIYYQKDPQGNTSFGMTIAPNNTILGYVKSIVKIY